MNIEYKWETLEKIKPGEVFYYDMDDAVLYIKTTEKRAASIAIDEVLCVCLSNGSCEWFNDASDVIPAKAKVVEL